MQKDCLAVHHHLLVQPVACTLEFLLKSNLTHTQNILREYTPVLKRIRVAHKRSWLMDSLRKRCKMLFLFSPFAKKVHKQSPVFSLATCMSVKYHLTSGINVLTCFLIHVFIRV